MIFTFVQISLIQHIFRENKKFPNFMPFNKITLVSNTTFQVNLNSISMFILILEPTIIDFQIEKI